MRLEGAFFPKTLSRHLPDTLGLGHAVNARMCGMGKCRVASSKVENFWSRLLGMLPGRGASIPKLSSADCGKLHGQPREGQMREMRCLCALAAAIELIRAHWPLEQGCVSLKAKAERFIDHL
ncbi:MAG: hypothetical protein KC587_16115, partial [Nitrospira sp.]|nr:hypothetical protein [Nitrospira sp.]